MSTVTLPSGVTERTTLPCTSLNQSVPSGLHSGPSVNLKPPATFSMTAAGATSASNAGSSRSIRPTAVVAAGAVATAGGGADAAGLSPLHPAADTSPATITGQLLRFKPTLHLSLQSHRVSLWQCVRDQLRTADTTHSDDNVLLAVDHIGHWRPR